MKGLTRVLALFLACSVQVAEAQWSVYQSDNFTLHTDLSDKGARTLIEDFETFRKAVLAVLSFPNTQENNRLRIVVYARRSDYNAIRPQENFVGFFMPTSSGPRMVIGPSQGMNKAQVLYHEYIHHLMQEHVKFPVPRWYHEGFAEVLSTTEVDGSVISSGKLDVNRLYALAELGLLPLEQLFDPLNEEASDIFMARFYATAMVFMHFLQVAPLDGGVDLRPGLSQFVYRISTGERPVDAVEPSFGMTLDELKRQLRSYYLGERHQYLRFEVLPYAGEISSRRLSGNEEATLLADMAMHLQKEDVALKYLQDLDPRREDAARGLALLAVLENHRDAVEASWQARDRAIALDQGDAEVLADVAHVYFDDYTRSSKDSGGDSALLDLVLQYASAAIEADADNMSGHNFKGLALRAQGRHAEAVQSMMAVYRLFPSSVQINADIGNYLLELDRPDLARPFIERVHSWSHDPAAIQQAKETLDRIDAALAE